MGLHIDAAAWSSHIKQKYIGRIVFPVDKILFVEKSEKYRQHTHFFKSVSRISLVLCVKNYKKYF